MIENWTVGTAKLAYEFLVISTDVVLPSDFVVLSDEKKFMTLGMPT